MAAAGSLAVCLLACFVGSHRHRQTNLLLILAGGCHFEGFITYDYICLRLFLLPSVNECEPSLIKNVSFHSLIDVGPQKLSLRNPTCSLAHRPTLGFDTICNSPNLPLVDIVLSGFSHKEEVPTPLKEMFRSTL